MKRLSVMPNVVVALLVCTAGLAWAGHAWATDMVARIDDGKLSFHHHTDAGSNVAMLDEVVVAIFKNEQLVYRSVRATQTAARDDVIAATYAGEGAIAEQVTVKVTATRVKDATIAEWTIDHEGADDAFDLIRLQMKPSTKAAAAAPAVGDFADLPAGTVLARVGSSHVVRHVRPDVDVHEGVPGDTPYRTTDSQVRTYQYRQGWMYVLTPWYDNDWAFRGNRDRSQLIYIKDVKAGGRTQFKMLLATANRHEASVETVPTGAEYALARQTHPDISAARLNAMLHDRIMAIDLRCDRRGHVFEPGEKVTFDLVIDPLADRRDVRLHVRMLDYEGKMIAQRSEVATLRDGVRRTLTVTAAPPQRGIYFVVAEVKAADDVFIDRATLAVLPPRKASGVDRESPFAIAALIARPDVYIEQFPLETVAAHAERVGIRRVRTMIAPLGKSSMSLAPELARERFEVLQRHGIALHAQLGSDGALALKDQLEPGIKDYLQTHGVDMFREVEVGNELNYKMTGKEYVDTVLAPSTKAIRAVAPDAKILSMGFGGVFPKWVNEFTEAGGFEHIDILSVHPSGFPRSPEYWAGWRGWVVRPMLLDAMSAANKAGKPVWVTECYAPTPPDRRQVDLRTSADYMVRMYAISLAMGVKMVEWYQFQDGLWFAQRPNPHDVEYNFGIVYSDLTPKPAYVAYAAMTEQLEGATPVGRLDLGADDLYAIRFMRDGKPIDVLWSTRERHETDIPWYPPEKFEKESRKPGEPWEPRWTQPVDVSLPTAGEVMAIDILGRPITLQLSGGKAKIALTGTPVYVHGLGDLPVLKEVWPPIPGGP